ncbi:hypothetical protein ABZ864_22280 [Streptomyces sp. NPDC047082]|uniref:DUF7691 family protein n=1 Tax=Streptomyces sp. NPDC047082 TaxID=3155259 RepID=UPI0033EC9DF2
MSTGDMRSVVRLLTSLERSAEQERRLGVVRDRCARADARLREQGIDLEVSVGQALEELIEGAPSADMGPAYTYAFHETVACHFSHTTDLGVWSRPSWFYVLDDELARHGVPADLLPGSFLFSGPPLRLPHPGDAFPQIGVLPTPRAGALASRTGPYWTASTPNSGTPHGSSRRSCGSRRRGGRRRGSSGRRPTRSSSGSLDVLVRPHQ